MPTRQSNPVIRHKIRLCETIIKERSKQVEEKWSIDPNQSNGKIGSRVDKNLSVLEILDGYNFDRIDSSNDCLDNLYNKLFGGNNSNNSSTGSSSSSGGSSGSGLDVEVIISNLFLVRERKSLFSFQLYSSYYWLFFKVSFHTFRNLSAKMFCHFFQHLFSKYCQHFTSTFPTIISQHFFNLFITFFSTAF